LPKQGSKVPWKLHQNYVKDVMSLKFGSVEDGVMRYLNRTDSLELRPPPVATVY
jgi:monooxygenase